MPLPWLRAFSTGGTLTSGHSGEEPLPDSRDRSPSTPGIAPAEGLSRWRNHGAEVDHSGNAGPPEEEALQWGAQDLHP